MNSFEGYDPDLFLISENEKVSVNILLNFFQILIDKVLLHKEQIESRCEKLAEMIFDNYKGQSFEIFVILKGAFAFFSDIHDALLKERAKRQPKIPSEDITFKV